MANVHIFDKVKYSLHVLSVLWSLLLLRVGRIETLECYNCTYVDTVNDCTTLQICEPSETCFIELLENGLNMGCINNQRCGVVAKEAVSLVGRGMDRRIHSGADSSSSEVRDANDLQMITHRDFQPCFECCSSDICNKHLCDHPQPATCIDDPKIDCAWMNSKFNICHILHEAKTVCPRFCGLCALVDGNWNAWSTWSACDVTCGKGIQSRYRLCNNPAPVSGGRSCPGNTTENMECSFPPCQVTPTVAFRCHNLANTTLGGKATLVYSNTTLNIGNGYDNQTGTFTAPTSGLYQFSAQFCLSSSGTNFIHFGIVQNNDYIKRGFVQGNNYSYECYNFDTVAFLNAGDTVYVENTGGAGELYQTSERWNEFSGFLVHV